MRGGGGLDYLTLYQLLPSPHLPAPPSYGCSPPLTAGSDYGCEKWGSHANNPPLQHSCSMTAHFLPALPLASLPSLPSFCLALSPCLSSAVLLFSSVCCFSHFHLNACAPARRERAREKKKKTASGPRKQLCMAGCGVWGVVGGWKCVIAPKLVELLAKKRERKDGEKTEKEEKDGAPRLPQAVKFKELVI